VPPEQPAIEEGFVSLFDGQTLKGWKGPKQHFFVRDGKLISRFPSKSNPDDWPRIEYAALLSVGQYRDFVLRLEFQIDAGGNSGVLVRAAQHGLLSREGLEVQIIDEYFPLWKDVFDKRKDLTMGGYQELLVRKRSARSSGTTTNGIGWKSSATSMN
jgi:hypothetical protein